MHKSVNADDEVFIASVSRIIVNMFVKKLIRASLKNMTQKSFCEYLSKHSPNDPEIERLISYNMQNENTEFAKQAKSFQQTISNRVLSSFDIQSADAKGKYIIKKIFQAYYVTPQQLPNHCVFEFMTTYDPAKYDMSSLLSMAKKEGVGKVRSIFSDIVSNLGVHDAQAKMILMRIICDDIAGMTDTFAQNTYESLYG